MIILKVNSFYKFVSRESSLSSERSFNSTTSISVHGREGKGSKKGTINKIKKATLTLPETLTKFEPQDKQTEKSPQNMDDTSVRFDDVGYKIQISRIGLLKENCLSV